MADQKNNTELEATGKEPETMGTRELREEIAELLQSPSETRRNKGRTLGLTLMERRHGGETPCGLHPAGIANLQEDGPVKLHMEMEPDIEMGDERPDAEKGESAPRKRFVTTLEAGAPLVSPVKLYQGAMALLDQVSGWGSLTATRQLLDAIARWMPIPSEAMGRQTLRQLSPTIWHQAPELASKYHRRRLLAMHAMERDTRDGLYVLRHDSHASCQHPEVYGRPWENRSRTAAYLLETADRTTCKRQYEILDRLRTISAQTEIGCGDSQSRNDINGREKSIVLELTNIQEKHSEIGVRIEAHGIGSIVPLSHMAALIRPRTLLAALTAGLRTAARQNMAEAVDAWATEVAKWLPAEPANNDLENTLRNAAPEAAARIARAIDQACHLHEQIEKHGRYLQNRRSNAELTKSARV